MTTPARLHIDHTTGKLVDPTGVAHITYNDPWPTKNGTPGAFGQAYGAVLHTEVGYEHTVIHEFNDPNSQASAFFSINMTTNPARIRQYGPVGLDWMAWTQVDGNPHWRGIEGEDDGNPKNPYSPPQLAAYAQVIEALSAFDGWPLHATDDPVNGRGIILHSDGGVPWGNHACPGPVRAAQRPAIIALALAIRKAATGPLPSGIYHADGHTSLAALVTRQGISVASAWWSTTQERNDRFGRLEEQYLNAGQWDAPMPAGMILYLP